MTTTGGAFQPGGSVFARLEAEWHYLDTSAHGARALQRWQRLEPDLAAWQTLEQLRAATGDRAQPDRADRLLAALVRLAATDGHDDVFAARVVVQLLLPGARRLANDLATMIDDRHQREAAVLGEITIGARTYPWTRRPARIAANILLDARQRLVRHHQRHRRETPTGANPGGELLASDTTALEARAAASHLLTWAHRRRILNPTEITILVASRGHDIPIWQIAQQLGRSRSSVYATRAAAEARLRHALTSHDNT